MLMRIWLGLLCFTFFAPLAAAQSGGLGSISGGVSDENGTAAVATILYQRLVLYSGTASYRGATRLVAGEIEARGRSNTTPEGSFDISNLPAGSYVVCAKPVDEQYVDSCDWDPPAHLIVNNAATAMPPLPHLKKGAPVLIHVLDPYSILFPSRNSAIGSGMIIGVHDAKGIFHRARLKSSGSSYCDFGITVPLGEDVQLWLFSRRLNIKDARGVPIPGGGYSEPLQLTGTKGATTSFIVAGLK